MNQEFCKECHNMLYPKEDKTEKKLYMACRNCEHFEDAKSYRVYYDRMTKVKDDAYSTHSKDLVSDPTLPRTNLAPCPKCNRRDACYFQKRDRQQEVALTVCFVCCSCFHSWEGIEEDA
ncbi:subunit Rpb9 of DNA-directed RNA polymerase II [Hamiltosporidium tvaerminnensis]|uniref:DNA-directed RNA polymerase II subunit RPB9 n=2 Tax=Hamiltosporidium TaxID=1176354 RepID=A0A4Q9KW12_9MICR|nr:subunit Rpb9 of DNA-directed RNA polymerase II [Hamiltosporidium magnivora]TBT99448.1 subunit Rpb9 of DNA-directed RNA polymerase II [Hamiltosporidium magnivora]TBU02284.1 subunit Rpb9 of DNA-directed RNA polymerase II [Hamiltosporidium tvaerminnensis]TBU13185.1 subunit Rpb9 of DNA-directed RNA polymerase II [Hamiltosporidium tvaerminnensis]